MATISNKQEMYRLLATGCLGNTLRLWSTCTDLHHSGFTGLVAIRSMRPGGEFKANIPHYHIDKALHMYLVRNQCGMDDIIMSEMDDHTNRRILSVECGHAHGLPVARYSDQHLLFRDAMKVAKHIQGASVRALLRFNLDTCDYETVTELMEVYPTSIIELTQYERPCGVEHKRCITWEIRDY